MTYIGAHTAYQLTKYSLTDMLSSHELNERTIRRTGSVDAHYTISIHETISVLMKEEPLSPRQIMKLLQSYTFILGRIASTPRQWNARFQLYQLTPELARNWYTDQIVQLRAMVTEVA